MVLWIVWLVIHALRRLWRCFEVTEPRIIIKCFMNLWSTRLRFRYFNNDPVIMSSQKYLMQTSDTLVNKWQAQELKQQSLMRVIPLDISLINSFHVLTLIRCFQVFFQFFDPHRGFKNDFKARGVYSDTVFKIHHSIIRGFRVWNNCRVNFKNGWRSFNRALPHCLMCSEILTGE